MQSYRIRVQLGSPHEPDLAIAPSALVTSRNGITAVDLACVRVNVDAHHALAAPN